MDIMMISSMLSVKNVTGNVKLVLTNQITVMNVKKTEDQSLTVTVHSKMVTTKLMDKPTVHLVIQDVKPVQFIIHVKPVKLTLTDLLHQNVHVLMDSMNYN
jgi:hypothetical protein